MLKHVIAGALVAGTIFTASPALATTPTEPARAEHDAARTVPRPPYKVRRAINHFWGSQYRQGQARRVAYCESRYSTYATNGQYLGIFQMGSYERATYGHGSTAWAQARGAHRYFVASGRDWSPWQCSPDGGLNW